MNYARVDKPNKEKQKGVIQFANRKKTTTEENCL